MRKIGMTNMRASVFNPDEALCRLGALVREEGERPQRGRNDRNGMVVSTTSFETILPGNVRLHGTIEFGVPRTTLEKMTKADKKGNRAFSFRGIYEVNDVAVRGTLIVDLRSHKATFTYSEKKEGK